MWVVWHHFHISSSFFYYLHYYQLTRLGIAIGSDVFQTYALICTSNLQEMNCTSCRQYRIDWFHNTLLIYISESFKLFNIITSALMTVFLVLLQSVASDHFMPKKIYWLCISVHSQLLFYKIFRGKTYLLLFIPGGGQEKIPGRYGKKSPWQKKYTHPPNFFQL